MAKELIISTNGREKKIAIIENDKVTEFYIERGESNQGIVGNIYKGRVMRVLPGMQSAFKTTRELASVNFSPNICCDRRI